ncbi:MAG: right-handed parallel beta-helix repeat-containing protein [bacterium]|nr:right-handed parallel beta-helix repeat-containing protein [bacterium]MDT8365952.1 right-handed parallel beta-helix repeat-containing protein [bacterium]
MTLSGIKGAFFFLVVLLLPVTALSALGQEIVPEVITGELILTGQHLMEKSVTVAKEGVLVLKAGARLRAAPDTSLTVQGTLRVDGSKDKPVEMSSPDGAVWKGITMLSGARGEITNGRILRAQKGISILAARLEVSETTISGSETAIHLVREAVAEIKGVRFTNNKVGLAAEMRSTGEISGCIFKDNNVGLGIASGGTPTVKGNRFVGNGLGIQVLQRYPGKIEGNIFEGNKAGIRLYQNGPDTIVERNRFVNNADAAVLALSYTSPVIRNNYMTAGKYGIYANQFSSPTIADNMIRKMEEAVHLNKKNLSQIKGNVVADSVIGIFCDFSSYPLIRGNLFSDNGAHLKLGKFQSSNWESRAGSKNFVLETAARQNSRNPRLGQGPMEFPEAVDATGNWWDKKTLREMMEKGADADISTLYDGHDLPEVTYEGFGEESYRLDKVLYLPALETEPEAAGLKGWKGTDDELLPVL